MPPTVETLSLALTDVTLTCDVTGDGPLIIAAHGFPDEANTFKAQLPALVAAGYRIVCPTLRGYAPSSEARSGRYDAAALGADLVALADHFSPNEPVRLLGHDWGAVATFAAAALAPSRFSHLVTMAVPHALALLPHLVRPAQARRSWYVGFFQIPWLSEIGLAEKDHALIDHLVRAWSPSYTFRKEELLSIKRGIRGRERAVLAYYRAFFSLGSLAGEPRRLLFRRTRVPSMHLHGVEDGCVGIECVMGAERGYEGPYEMHRIERAGHFLHRERPREVNEHLLSFFA